MNITFDSLKEEYIDDIHGIELASFSDPWSKQLIENEVSNSLAFYEVALSDGKVVGYGGVYRVMDEGNITNIAVNPDFRRQGIADMILKRLEVRCVQSGVTVLFLEVREGNDAAISLYKKHGFEITGERKGYYSDNGEDAYIMTKYF